MDALKRANDVRVRRAKLKKDLKDGRVQIEKGRSGLDGGDFIFLIGQCQESTPTACGETTGVT